MPKLYVLEVPEFAPLIDAARARRYATVSRGGYAVISAPDEIAIERQATGLGEAVWFGALTGGFAGRIAEFHGGRLRIVD
jgi:hypothetical protein